MCPVWSVPDCVRGENAGCSYYYGQEMHRERAKSVYARRCITKLLYNIILYALQSNARTQ